jgi:hypothetical protein
MTTTQTKRWPIWTDGGTGSADKQVTPATWIYRQEDGSYLTIFPDGSEVVTPERPSTPKGQPVPLQFNRVVARLTPGPSTDSLVADLEAAGGSPDRDLLWRLVACIGKEPDAPALLVAEGVRVVCERGWVGSKTKSRSVTVKATYYL